MLTKTVGNIFTTGSLTLVYARTVDGGEQPSYIALICQQQILSCYPKLRNCRNSTVWCKFGGCEVFTEGECSNGASLRSCPLRRITGPAR